MFTLIKRCWRQLRAVCKTPVPSKATPATSRRAPGVGTAPQFGRSDYDSVRNSGSESDALVTSALVGMAVGSMYNRDWEMYGPLDECSAEQLIDGQLDPDARALQARDAGYEGARGDDEAYDPDALLDDHDELSYNGGADYSSYDASADDWGSGDDDWSEPSEDWASGDDGFGSEGDTW